MTLGPVAHIDLDALRHNLARAREIAPGCKLIAVVKADAYGHGIERLLPGLGAADALAVARLSEALALRRLGAAQRILVLEGARQAGDFQTAVAHGLDLVFHRLEQIDWLEQAAIARPLATWLKVDTGMHRLGLAPDQAASAYQRLVRSAKIQGKPHLLTHLANADDLEDDYTRLQLKRFQTLAGQFATETSIANSAGLIGWPDSRGDWLRPGLMLYGASPLLGGRADDHGLRPVMTLQSRLMAIHYHERGEPLGYGGRYRCPEAMSVGVVAIGYGDGYPRSARDGTPVLIRGQQLPLVGRVSMDMITVDLRSLPDARVGDPVTLWGEGLPAEIVAEHADTIPYTLFCGVTGRVRFEVVGSGH